VAAIAQPRRWSLTLVVACTVSACTASTPLTVDRTGGADGSKGADASSGLVNASERLAKAMDPATTCDELEELHAEAIAAAQRCDPDGGADQCLVNVRLSLACGCTTTTNDATESNAIAVEWAKRGCPKPGHTCVEGCLVVASPTPCMSIGGGLGMCQPRGP
jgi:hypothetical protein